LRPKNRALQPSVLRTLGLIAPLSVGS
jgi:hypothetical protein